MELNKDIVGRDGRQVTREAPGDPLGSRSVWRNGAISNVREGRTTSSVVSQQSDTGT